MFGGDWRKLDIARVENGSQGAVNTAQLLQPELAAYQRHKRYYFVSEPYLDPNVVPVVYFILLVFHDQNNRGTHTTVANIFLIVLLFCCKSLP